MIGDFAFDGPVLVMPARVALILFDELRVEQARIAVRGIDPVLDRVLAAWREVAAAEVRARVGTVSGTPLGGSVPDGGPSVVMGTQAVVAATGLSERGVRKAVDRGALRTLPRDGHALRYCAEDVATFVASRDR